MIAANEAVARSVGKPVAGMHVVLDSSRTGADGPGGEILAYGAHVMAGYHNKPEETRAALHAGWYHTGDVATRDGAITSR